MIPNTYFLPIDYKSEFVGRSKDVNYVELLAVPDAILYLSSQRIPILSNFNYIHIITDNKQVWGWISGLYNIKQSYVCNQIIRCYQMHTKII